MQDVSRMSCHLYADQVDRIEELRYLVLAAQREGNRRLTDALRPLDVTPAQAEVLGILAGSAAPLSVKELGALLVCESGRPTPRGPPGAAGGGGGPGRRPAGGRAP